MPDREEQAADEATDSRRLLPGEDVDSHLRKDALHWVQVYTELRDTKHHLIAELKSKMEQVSAPARAELGRADLRILELQVERFERRLAFWRERAEAAD